MPNRSQPQTVSGFPVHHSLVVRGMGFAFLFIGIVAAAIVLFVFVWAVCHG